MKELTIEEKAKAYDEAIEKASKLRVQNPFDTVSQMMEHLFPELKESDDERIRKELLNAFQESEDSLYMVLTPHRRESFISWLEKQGEKIPVVEFNAKDWYVSKVDGKIYNAKFMEKTPINQTRKLEIEKAAMSATGIIEQEEWFIKGAEWSDKNPCYISSEK